MSAIFVLVLDSVVGCTKEQRGGPRIGTYPIEGVVFVDGEPANYLAVRCVPDGDKSETEGVPSSSGFTDPDGRFSIGTYEKGDGAPEGQYKLTFQYGRIDLLSGLYGGDRLNGKYLDPAKSEIRVDVVKGQRNDLGRIDLTSAKETE